MRKINARLAIKILATLFAVIAILFVIAAWRLSSGPISINFIGSYIESSLNNNGSNYKIQFSDTILSWEGWDRSLDILAIDMKILNQNGEVVTNAPRASIGLSTSALLSGDIEPTSIEFLGADIRLVRDKTGNIVFGSTLRSEDISVENSSSDRDKLDSFLEGFVNKNETGENLFTSLKTISINNGDLHFDDQQQGFKWRIPKVDFVFDVNTNLTRGEGKFELETSGDSLRVNATITIEPGNQVVVAKMDFEDLIPSKVHYLSEVSPRFSIADGILNGKIHAEMDFKGNLIKPINFEAEGYSGIIEAPDFVPTPRSFEYFRTLGKLDTAAGFLQINDFFLDAGGPTFSFEGNIVKAKKGYGINGEVSIIDMPFNDLHNYWPDTLLLKTRTWVLRNVSEGVMTRFTADINLKPGQFPLDLHSKYPKNAITAEFNFENTTVNYLKSMPLVKGVDGSGRADMHTMLVEMSGGHIGEIKASYGQASFWDLTGGSQPSAAMTIHVESSIRDALELINREPLGLGNKYNLSKGDINGEVNLNFTVQFPVDYNISIKDMDLNAIAQLRSVSGKNLLSQGYKLSEGNFELRLSNNRLDLEGVANLNEVPFDIKLEENFGSETKRFQYYTFSSNLNSESQKSLGLNLEPYLDGPFDFDVVVSRLSDESYQAIAAIDFSAADLHIPEIHWNKISGDKAFLNLVIDIGNAPGKLNISKLEFNAKDLFAEGNAQLNLINNNRITIEQARLKRVLFGDNDIGMTFDNERNNLPIVKISGESIDLRPFLDEFFDEGISDTPPFILDIDVNRLITRSNQQITDVRGKLKSVSKRLEVGYLEGVLPTGKNMRVVMDSNATKRRVRIMSDDAGAFARAFDIYDDIIGGKLFIWAKLNDQKSPLKISGEINISNYRIINTPLLAQILNIASLTGILESLQGEGIAFSTLVVPFKKEENILAIDRARALGASLGIHANGSINLDNDVADIVGTIAPAYVINSFISNIPIIGEVLAGGKGEGLFAATYTVQGELEAPTITVNPLAALTPGFLRNIFSVFEEGGVEPDFKEDN